MSSSDVPPPKPKRGHRRRISEGWLSWWTGSDIDRSGGKRESSGNFSLGSALDLLPGKKGPKSPKSSLSPKAPKSPKSPQSPKSPKKMGSPLLDAAADPPDPEEVQLPKRSSSSRSARRKKFSEDLAREESVKKGRSRGRKGRRKSGAELREVKQEEEEEGCSVPSATVRFSSTGPRIGSLRHAKSDYDIQQLGREQEKAAMSSTGKRKTLAESLKYASASPLAMQKMDHLVTLETTTRAPLRRLPTPPPSPGSSASSESTTPRRNGGGGLETALGRKGSPARDSPGSACSSAASSPRTPLGSPRQAHQTSPKRQQKQARSVSRSRSRKRSASRQRDSLSARSSPASSPRKRMLHEDSDIPASLTKAVDTIVQRPKECSPVKERSSRKVSRSRSRGRSRSSGRLKEDAHQIVNQGEEGAEKSHEKPRGRTRSKSKSRGRSKGRGAGASAVEHITGPSSICWSSSGIVAPSPVSSSTSAIDALKASGVVLDRGTKANNSAPSMAASASAAVSATRSLPTPAAATAVSPKRSIPTTAGASSTSGGSVVALPSQLATTPPIPRQSVPRLPLEMATPSRQGSGSPQVPRRDDGKELSRTVPPHSGGGRVLRTGSITRMMFPQVKIDPTSPVSVRSVRNNGSFTSRGSSSETLPAITLEEETKKKRDPREAFKAQMASNSIMVRSERGFGVPEQKRERVFHQRRSRAAPVRAAGNQLLRMKRQVDTELKAFLEALDGSTSTSGGGANTSTAEASAGGGQRGASKGSSSGVADPSVAKGGDSPPQGPILTAGGGQPKLKSPVDRKPFIKAHRRTSSREVKGKVQDLLIYSSSPKLSDGGKGRGPSVAALEADPDLSGAVSPVGIKGKIRQIAEQFMKAPLSAFGDGLSEVTIERIQVYAKEASDEDRSHIIRLLFILSTFSRYEQLLASKPALSPVKKVISPRGEANLVESIIAPKTPHEEESIGTLQQIADDSMAEYERNHQVLQHLKQSVAERGEDIVARSTDRRKSTSRPRHKKRVKSGDFSHNTPSSKQTPVICRICERMVPRVCFKDHSNLCTMKTQWEVRVLECNDVLGKISSSLSRRRKEVDNSTPVEEQDLDHYEGLVLLRERAMRARKLPACKAALDQIAAMVTRLEECSYEGGDLKAQVANLKKLFLFKQQAIVRIMSHSDIITRLNPVSGAGRLRETKISIPNINDFKILKPITKGGFARVYLAKKKATGDYYAIKVLKKQDMVEKNQVENVIAERNILATVSCPYVVRLYYAFQTKENLCLAMEFLNGGDLFSLLMAMGCFEEDVARFYIAETLLAVEYLHSRGIVHRDIKPDNVLINSKGHVKLTDFGLSHVGLSKQTAEFLKTVDEEDKLEGEGVVGTPDYLAPEVLLGLKHNECVDYWAIGCILYEFITGVPPFSGDSPQEIFQNILTGEIVWPDVPEDMSENAKDLITKLLASDPHERLGANGMEEVKKHPFFDGLEWDKLFEVKVPPFVPTESSPDDTSYFEAREQYWPLIEEDFGSLYRKSEKRKTLRPKDSTFGIFWCVNVANLHEKNVEVMDNMGSID